MMILKWMPPTKMTGRIYSKRRKMMMWMTWRKKRLSFRKDSKANAEVNNYQIL